MFRVWDEQCGSTKPHRPHYTQRGFLWTDESFCRGVAEQNPWRKANPSLGKRTKSELEEDVRLGRITKDQARAALGLPKPHKHFYKLVRFYKFPHSYTISAVPIDRLAWQCECGSILSRYRYEMMEEMRPAWKNVEQTWPQ